MPAPAKAMSSAMWNLMWLHVSIADQLVTQKYLPHAQVRDGLATAVSSHFALDVNLKLFEAVGRIALTGIWLQFFGDRHPSLSKEEKDQLEQELSTYTNDLIDIFNNNGVLRTPITDSQSIEVSLVCIFLAMRDRYDAIRDCIEHVLSACLFAIASNTAYPCVLSDYQELAEHPKARSDTDYFKRATAGSTLFPSLVVWKRLSEPTARFPEIAKFIENKLSHCTLQLWVPNKASEEHIYTNTEVHGLALLGLYITENSDELLEVLLEECRHNRTIFQGLSAIKLGFWPIILTACRHHRIPIPPNFWEKMAENLLQHEEFPDEV